MKIKGSMDKGTCDKEQGKGKKKTQIKKGTKTPAGENTHVYI